MVDTISNVITNYLSQGADKAAVDFGRVTGAQDKLAESNTRIVQTNETLTRSMINVQNRLDAQTRSLDPLSAATKKLADVENTRTRALQQGLTLSAANDRAYENARARVAELEKAVAGHTAAVGLNRMQQLEGIHVLKSFADQVIAGQSPMRALAVEGGRIGQIFTSGEGGVGGTFKALAGTVAGLVNPFVLGGAAIVGFGAAAMLAASHVAEMDRVTQRALSGAGRVTGLGTSGFNSLVSASSGQTGVGLADTRASALALASSGKFSAGNMSSILGLVPGYAGAFGTSYADAGQQLADIFSDPAKGAEKLNERLGFLTEGTKQYIASLERQGRTQEAVAALVDAAKPGLNEQVQQVGVLDRMWQRIKDSAAFYADDLGKLGSGPTPMELYRAASRNAGNRSLPDEYVRPSGRTAPDPTFGPDGTNDLAETMRRQAQLQKMQTDTVLANRQSLLAGDAIRSFVPDESKLAELKDWQTALKDVTGNTSAMLALGAAGDHVHTALDRVTAAIATFQTAAQQIRTDSALNIAVIQAEGFSQKVAAESAKTYLEALRSTHDANIAGARAETQRSEAIATATKQAQDAAREQRNQDALLGLKPAQRLAAERDQAIAAAKRDYGTGAGSSAAFAAAPADIQAMITAASAMTGIPAAIVAAIGQKENGFRLSGPTGIMGPNGKPASTAWGFGQLTDGAAADVAKVMPGFSKYDPSTAVMGAAEYVKILLGRNHGDMTAALNAYGGRSDYASQILGGANDNGLLAIKTGMADSHYTSQSDALKKGIVDQATEGLNRQNQALALQKASFGASAQAIAEMAKKQELLNQLQDAGLDKDPAMLAWADQMAAGYGRAAKAVDELAKSQSKAVEQMDAIRSVSKDALSTFVTDMRQGKSAGDALLDVANRLVDKMLDMAENSIINGLFGATGTAGSSAFASMIAGVFHEGGMAGQASSNRAVSPAVFIGAPRYHSGLGLGHDERAAILQVGEMVVPKGAVADARRQRAAAQAGADGRGYGGGSQQAPIINVMHAPGTTSTVTHRRGPNLEQFIDIAVENSIMKQIDGNGKAFRAMKNHMGVSGLGRR